MGKGGLLGVGQQLPTSKPHAIQLEMGKGTGKVSATAHHHREVGTEDKCGHFCTYLVLGTFPQGAGVNTSKTDVVLRRFLLIHVHTLPMLP